MRKRSIVLTLIVFVISLIIATMYCTYEAFQSAGNEIAYATNKLNHTSWVGSNTRIAAITLTSAQDIYDSINANGSFPKQIAKRGLWIASPIEYDLYLSKANNGQRQTPVASVVGYYVVLGIPAHMFAQECAFNWYDKTIGYIDWCDMYLIRSIMKGYRIPDSAVNVVQAPMQEWASLIDYMVNNKVDMIVAYVVPNSAFHRLLMMQQLSIVGWSKLDIDRVKVFHPYVTPQEVDVKSVLVKGETTSLMVMDREKYGPLLAMTMNAYPIITIESFVTRLDISPTAQDPSYRCYGEITIEHKAMCESPFDSNGEAKVKRTIWDRPCVQDSDCPFYRANTNYKNNRGGCLSGGVCEMPVGVLRTAFRQYDAKGTNGRYSPFCYQCSDPSDKQCCAKQTSPDYAFANDYNDRKNANLPTFVSAI